MSAAVVVEIPRESIEGKALGAGMDATHGARLYHPKSGKSVDLLVVPTAGRFTVRALRLMAAGRAYRAEQQAENLDDALGHAETIAAQLCGAGYRVTQTAGVGGPVSVLTPFSQWRERERAKSYART